MLVALAELAHALGQVRGQQAGQHLHHPVGHPAQAQPLEPAIDAALQRERGRHAGGAEAVDQQEAVLAVAFADVIGIAVDVLTGNRQALEAGQQLAPDRGEAVGAVAADVEDFGGLLLEGVQAHREHRQLAGRSGGLEVAAGVGIEARRGIGIDRRTSSA
jgi:hypothetical protein